MVFHCLNRSVARLTLFEKLGDYEAFERVMEEAFEKIPLRILDFVVMPNHWHFVVWPQTDREVSDFFQWLTVTHSMRWHAHHGTSTKRNYADLVFCLKSNGIILPRLDHRYRSQGGTAHGHGWRTV